MNEDENVIEVRRDYSTVNRYVDHILDRHKDLLAYNQINRWKLVLWGLGILFLCIALAYYIYSWALYIQKKEPSSETADVVLTEPNISKDKIEKITSETKENAGSSTSAEYVKRVTVDFTVFKSVELTKDRSINTGYKFNPEKIDYPDYQYCYMTTYESKNTSKRVDLGSKKGKERIVWDLDADQDLYQLGQEHCSFRFE